MFTCLSSPFSLKREGMQPNESIFYVIFEGLFAQGRADTAHYVWRTVRNTVLFKPSKVTQSNCSCCFRTATPLVVSRDIQGLEYYNEI